MSIVTKCNCDFELCKFPGHIKNVHVDDKCVHGSGVSHKTVKEVVEISTNYRFLETWANSQ